MGMQRVRRAAAALALVATVLLTSTGCVAPGAVSETSDTGLKQDLIARGYTGPVLIEDGAWSFFNGSVVSYSVAVVNNCRVVVEWHDNGWYYTRSGGQLWAAGSASGLYELGKRSGMFTNVCTTPTAAL